MYGHSMVSTMTPYIVDAFNIYIERIEKGDLEYVHWTWGYGDSLDRERVRDIILEQPQFTSGW